MAARNRKPDDDSIDIRGIESRSGMDYTNEAHRNRVATAAYYKAERRGFSSGAELDDWFAAEQEIKSETQKDEDKK